MKDSYNLSTQGMQDRGIHYMGNKIKHDIDVKDLENAKKMAEKQQMEYVERIMDKDKGCKNYSDKTIVPCNSTVILKPYDRNPYRVPLRESSSGLIVGDFESDATYTSPDSGEREAAKKGIWCCSVIAVGQDCKNVQVGDDVYANLMIAAPVPFGGYGYYAVSEQNIICSIRNK